MPSRRPRSQEPPGLTISDAIRILLKRIAREGALPFELRAPNAATVATFNEPLEARKGYVSYAEMAADLDTEEEMTAGRDVETHQAVDGL